MLFKKLLGVRYSKNRFQVAELDEQLRKTELCLRGVAEEGRARAAEKEGLEREVRKRDKALEILTKEYEALKVGRSRIRPKLCSCATSTKIAET